MRFDVNENVLDAGVRLHQCCFHGMRDAMSLLNRGLWVDLYVQFDEKCSATLPDETLFDRYDSRLGFGDLNNLLAPLGWRRAVRRFVDGRPQETNCVSGNNKACCQCAPVVSCLLPSAPDQRH